MEPVEEVPGVRHKVGLLGVSPAIPVGSEMEVCEEEYVHAASLCVLLLSCS